MFQKVETKTALIKFRMSDYLSFIFSINIQKYPKALNALTNNSVDFQ